MEVSTENLIGASLPPKSAEMIVTIYRETREIHRLAILEHTTLYRSNYKVNEVFPPCICKIEIVVSALTLSLL